MNYRLYMLAFLAFGCGEKQEDTAAEEAEEATEETAEEIEDTSVE